MCDKPVDGFGGAGVAVVSKGDSNAAVLFELISNNGKVPIVVQGFLPEANEGDKRVLCFDGEVLGAIRRTHSKCDHRNNLAVGGQAYPAEITQQEHDIMAQILPELTQKGILFIGFDFIGERLIEVNVTSPTGLQELSRFSNTPHARHIVTKILNLA